MNGPPSPPNIATTPPGPSGHWLFGCLKQLRNDPLGLYESAWRQYGDYVRLRVLPRVYFYLLVHPDAVEQVLQRKNKNYRKPDILTRPVSLLMGNGLFTSEGDFWLRQRRLMQPAFHRQKVASLVSLMTAAAEMFVKERHAAAASPVIDILAAMMKLSLRIAGTTLFSTDVSGEADSAGAAYRTAFHYINYRMNHLLAAPTWVPTPRNLAFVRARKLLDGVVLQLIQARRHAATKPDDLLSLLLAAQDEETGVGMTDQQLKDEVVTLLTAGHETVGASLSWTWYLLARNPSIQNDVYDEIRGRLRGRNPVADDLVNLPLTRAAFEESMRLYPPAWGIPREAIEADEINGFSIQPRVSIALCQYLTHRHPEFWQTPDEFQPARFLGAPPESRPKYAYFPFGGGPRVCIGNTFAIMEATAVLATILQQFRVELLPGEVAIPDPTFTLRPKGSLKMMLLPR